MHTILLILHIIAALLLILFILIQSAKAGGLGGIFGGGGGEQLFSTPSGSVFLRKVTITIAIVFILTSIGLTFLGHQTRLKTVTGQVQPAAPAPVQPALPESE